MDSLELDAAVKSGVISPEVARDLRNFSAEQRQTPLADEERFGLVGGLADVMTAAGLLLLLGGVAFAFAFVPILAILIVLGASWAFAEHFTRQRRMTLTSFVLFGAFVVAALAGLIGVATVFPTAGRWPYSAVGWGAMSPLAGLVVSFGTAMTCGLYWLRFKLPFAYMTGAVAGVNVGVHVVHLVTPNASASVVSFMLLLVGLWLFAVAMWWDMSDVRRETRRADIAFWMHWAAGYQIAGASFRLLLGVSGSPTGWDRLDAFATHAGRRRRGDRGHLPVRVLLLRRAGDRPALAADVEPDLCRAGDGHADGRVPIDDDDDDRDADRRVPGRAGGLLATDARVAARAACPTISARNCRAPICRSRSPPVA